MFRKIPFAVTTILLLSTFAGITSAEDLSVRILNCPRSAKAGQDLFPGLRVAVKNNGDKAVKDASISIVMRKDSVCASAGRPAVYSPRFFDGVLLRDGRQYVSVDPGQTVTIKPFGANTIPSDTPVGRTYYICADIGYGEVGKQDIVPGPCACCPVRIIGMEARSDITGFAETCVTRRGTITIFGSGFGSGADRLVVMQGDGISRDLSVISWRDNAIVARIPDDASIREGRVFSIVIQRADRSEFLGNRKNITICPAQKRPAPANPLPPVSPFLH